MGMGVWSYIEMDIQTQTHGNGCMEIWEQVYRHRHMGMGVWRYGNRCTDTDTWEWVYGDMGTGEQTQTHGNGCMEIWEQVNRHRHMGMGVWRYGNRCKDTWK